MPDQEYRGGDSHFSTWIDSSTPLDDNSDIVQLSVARARATEDAAVLIARQLNGPLTALLLYMNEIKQHSHQFSQAPGDRIYLQQVVENALQQTERVCAMVKQMSDKRPGLAAASDRKQGWEGVTGGARDGGRAPGAMSPSENGHKPLTKREREVLSLISEGCSNKQGALRMKISPRTFESHRAEAMRKLGARNTAELVRKALLQSA
jgi:DNA-binding CsgD family transcriptional regulator